MARLLSVHAHPDDEASKGAPTIARYVADGHQAYLVTATGGEAGDILNPAMDRPEIRENLPAVRAEELERAVEAIGFDELVWLGYRDSGMAETEANEHPECFAQADLDEATGRLVAIVRRLQPDVIITYSDDQQGYRHPDHLRVHDISILAYDRAGDPTWYPEAGPVWQPAKLYYSTWSRARMVAHHERFAQLGLESPYDDTWFSRPSQDERITTRVDIADFYPVRTAALLAHATQVDPDAGFWFGLPDAEAADAYPWEDYILARSTVATDVPEDDLLAGLEAGSGTAGGPAEGALS
ncbi:MAG: mycothiol conjugate amidase Mca [Acidimicrobiales bacterium]